MRVNILVRLKYCQHDEKHTDINDKLMDLNKKNKDINKKDEPKQLGNTTNNLFVGTTTDLQRLIHAESGVVIDADKSE